MKKIILTVIVLALGIPGAILIFIKSDAPSATVSNFEECIIAGNPVMESYPRQCRHGDKSFTENIGNTIEKADLVRLESPRPNQTIKSPLTIKGEARGYWFFEASLPVFLTNWNGLIIAQGIATAKGDPDANDGAGWMTTEFVPFEATLNFSAEKNVYSNEGTLILRKNNPSSLPEHDDALEIPVVISSEPNTNGENKIPTSADNAPPGSIHNLPVPQAVAAVRSLVAKELKISEGLVIIMTAFEKNWPDGCLGLGKGKACTQAIVPGYEVTVQAQGKELVYRTNADGSIIIRDN